MAEHDEPLLRGEFLEIIRRLDERISALDRNMGDRMTSMENRLLSLENWMKTSMMTMIVIIAGVAVQIVLTLLK